MTEVSVKENAILADGLSRRSFLKASGAAAAVTAGMMLIGCSPKGNENLGPIPSEWNDEADVVIIGGGGAGFSAAMAATEAGSTVIVLEKGTMTGGSTALCGQAIMGVGTSVQKALGIEDSVDKAMEYFKAVGDAREDLTQFVLEHSGEAVDWLIGLGMKVPEEAGCPGLAYGGQELEYADVAEPIMRTHWSVKPDPGLWPVLQKAVEASEDINVLTETPAIALVQDPVTNEIIGVITDNEGHKAIKAHKAVILAAGGYARNPQMMKSLISQYEIQTSANDGDEGDGLNLGISAGAGIGYFGMLTDVQYTNPAKPCVYVIIGPDNMEDKPSFIAVNINGERFTDERKFYSYVGQDILKQPEGRGYIVTCGENGLKGLGAAGEESMKGETLEELAKQIGIDPTTLVGAVEQWNKNCAAGSDPQCGRTTELYPLENGPYYAAEIKAGCASTFGGVDIDTEMHVIGAIDKKPIPRLYAAGMNTLAVGRFYPTCGTAVAGAITTGLQAGRSAAAETAIEE